MYTPCKRPKGKSRRERINIKKESHKKVPKKKLTKKKKLIPKRKRFGKTFVNSFYVIEKKKSEYNCFVSGQVKKKKLKMFQES